MMNNQSVKNIINNVEILQKEKIKILSFYYLFENQENNRELNEEQSFMRNLCISLEIKGTVLVSKEGINGTVSGECNNVQNFLDEIYKKLKSNDFSSINDIFELKFSEADFVPFSKLKILLKNEVVALQSDMGSMDQSLKPINADSKKWNELLESKAVQLIDTRNDYEFQIGTFKNSINPEIKNFREFKEYLKEAIKKDKLDKDKPCAIFCTGGIRCEKAGIYMRNLGFKEVYQLRGGILKYFEETGNDQKKWIGDCFVFDDRITVNEKLEPGELRCIHCHCKIETNEEKKSVTKARISCLKCSSSK